MAERAIFVILLLVPALSCYCRVVVDDPDVWWHLRAGEWILQHRGWPTVDVFSSYGYGQPWAAYSWIAELLLYGVYQTLGLRGLVLYTAMLSVAIVAALSNLIRRLQPNSLLAVTLTLAAVLGLIPLQMPRPWLFSILFFIVELHLLLTAGRTGNRRLLLWLVPLFVLWANTHIQFVMGLVILGLAVMESVLARIPSIPLADEDSRRMPIGWMLWVFGLCAAATLVNPYHYHIYEVALRLVGQSKLWNVIQELGAMRFRSASHWTVLAVTVAAAFALGWRRRVRLLLVLLFASAVYLSFRSQRDAWFVLLVGLVILAYAGPKATGAGSPMRAPLDWSVAAVVALLAAGGSLLLSTSKLESQVAESFPVRAVEFIAQGEYPEPMFNSFAWGGYLILHLPQVPVSIDGRTMVHGQERVARHAQTLRGKGTWREDPELATAGLVVLPCQGTLTALLRFDSRFRLVYEDSVAAVFERNPSSFAQREPK